MKVIVYKNSLGSDTEELANEQVTSRKQAQQLYRELLQDYPCAVYEIKENEE